MPGFSIRIRRVDGPTLRMHCPRCGAEDVEAETREQRETFLLLHVLPLFWICNRFVACSACGRQFLSALPLEQLAEYPPDLVRDYLRPKAGFLGALLAGISASCWWFPALGVLFGLLAVLVNYGKGGWVRLLSWAGLLLSLLVTGGIVALVFFLGE